MSKHTVNFTDDLPSIRAHIQARVEAQSKDAAPIAAIEVGLKLCQQGVLAIHFDVRAHHERDGGWMRALNGPALELPGWSKAFMQADRFGISFILLDGRTVTLPPGTGNAAVAGIFGSTLLSIVRDAVVDGVFRPLALRDDCQVEVLEFDWMWEWPADIGDLGRTNLLHDLPTMTLPSYEQEALPTLSRPQPEEIVDALASKAGLTAVQARAFLQAQAELAVELVDRGYPIPGIGLLTKTELPARIMTLRFGPQKGKTIEVPPRRKLKFTIAPALKDATFGDQPSMPDVFSLEWYSQYTADDE